MRQITTLPEDTARKLSDYLLTLEIETHLQPDEDGLAVWVRDEDQVARARQELERYLLNPEDARYGHGASLGRKLRHQQEREESEPVAEEEEEEPVEEIGPRPLTFAVIALCLLVAMATHLGQREEEFTQILLVQSKAGGESPLSEVASGQVWRLITPIFLHFNSTQLIFNLMMFLFLAGQVEAVGGTARLFLLLVPLAVVSTLAEFSLGRLTFGEFGPELQPVERFGSLSGVVYGLFGYLWVKSRLRPHAGYVMPLPIVVVLLSWFLLAPLVLKDVAAAAQAGGLAAGLALGMIPGREPPKEEEE